ncbi:bifunctional diguanylate cyclase/phosphodiesterase [Allohahella marinimesophila]|uniref:EAL domain-containing protein n=1 Tax=Allohahella marinimesophila TaxID=1054972 RepID=A0ABP7NZ68_9GAMM
MVKAFLKSPLGRLAILFLLLTTLALVIASHYKWQHLQQDLRKELANVHKMMESSAADRFHQQEAMFEIVGQRLLDMDAVNNVPAALTLMNGVIENNPVFVAYKLIRPDGRVIGTSENLASVQHSNLLKTPHAAETFRTALDSNRLTLGRTWFSEALDLWVFPVRYAVRDSQGTVKMVISAAIALDGEYNPWTVKTLRLGIDVFVTIREPSSQRFYPLYYEPFSSFGASKQQAYANPLPKSFVQTVISKVEEATGQPFSELLQRDFSASFLSDAPNLAPAMAVSGYDKDHQYFLGIRETIPNLRKDFGDWLFLVLIVYLFVNALVAVTFYRMFLVEERHKAKLRHQAMHDSLTDLPNRYYLKTHYSSWVESTGGDYALFFLDLDNFKFINDHFGHSVGDLVLLEVAQRLKVFCTPGMLLIRQGGDEFLLLMPCRDKAGCMLTVDQLTHRLNEVMVVDNLKISVTGSIGITFCSQAGEALDALMVKADIAMYQAKKLRNSHAVFSEDLQKKSDERAVMESELRGAIDNGELYMVYQPQVEAVTGKVSGVEALLRWNNPLLGLVPPDRFIPVAEDCGLINPIGNLVVDTALKEIAGIHGDYERLRLSINVSVQQLVHGGFRDYIKQKCADYDLPNSLIKIEITESLFIEDFWQIENLLKLLSGDGFSISLDDFGTGYSSLSVLRKLPINEVKIDKSFVQDILSDPHDRALIKSIISIGQSLEIPTLAEGVEDIDQALLLRQYGCNLFQGYLFAKPMKLEDLKIYLQGFEPYPFDAVR